jgi:hypothetical protein
MEKLKTKTTAAQDPYTGNATDHGPDQLNYQADNFNKSGLQFPNQA